MTVLAPKADERDYIHDKYFGELVPGILLDETRDGLVEIIARMRDPTSSTG